MGDTMGQGALRLFGHVDRMEEERLARRVAYMNPT